MVLSTLVYATAVACLIGMFFGAEDSLISKFFARHVLLGTTDTGDNYCLLLYGLHARMMSLVPLYMFLMTSFLLWALVFEIFLS